MIGHWPTDVDSGGKSEATTTTPAATEQEKIDANIDAMSAAEIADELKEAECRKEKEEDIRLEDIQHLVSLSLQKLQKVEEADRVAKEEAKVRLASVQVSPEPEAAETREGARETKKKKKKKKKKPKDLQELAKQQLQSPSKN